MVDHLNTVSDYRNIRQMAEVIDDIDCCGSSINKNDVFFPDIRSGKGSDPVFWLPCF